MNEKDRKIGRSLCIHRIGCARRAGFKWIALCGQAALRCGCVGRCCCGFGARRWFGNGGLIAGRIIVSQARPRIPHGWVLIGIGRQGFLLNKLAAGNQSQFRCFTRPNGERNRSKDYQNDDDSNEIKKLARHVSGSLPTGLLAGTG